MGDYTISPCWNWRWIGKGSEAMGELAEARTACERAMELEAGGGEETDAQGLLDALGQEPGSTGATQWRCGTTTATPR